MEINKGILEIFSFLKNFEENEKIFLVGGAVRDSILGKKPKDLDFAFEGDAVLFYKNLLNKNVKNFKILSEKFQSCSFFYKNYEISFNSCRKDIYNDKLTIEKATIEEDLERRDFTINAIALSLNLKLIDPLNGIKDILDRKIRIINEDSFKQDPSRIVRASRYSYKMGFSIEDVTLKKLEESLDLITIDNSRITKEIIRTLREFSYKILEQELFKKILEKLDINLKYKFFKIKK